MAAYGLYTHIASNKFRSMLLLAGLFLLIYVLVYAGALLAEVLIDSDRSVDYYLMRAYRDLVMAFLEDELVRCCVTHHRARDLGIVKMSMSQVS